MNVCQMTSFFTRSIAILIVLHSAIYRPDLVANNVSNQNLGMLSHFVDEALALPLASEAVAEKPAHVRLVQEAKQQPRKRSELSLRGGPLTAKEKLFLPTIYNALRNADVAEVHAAAIANALTRMPPAYVKKLVAWNILEASDAETLNAREILRETVLQALALKVSEFVASYNAMKFTSQQTNSVMIRFYPPHLFIQFSEEMQIARSHLANMLRGHPDFEEWIEECLPLVKQLTPAIGISMAWTLMMSEGPSGAMPYYAEGQTVVALIAQEVGGENAAWRIVAGQGPKDTEEWVHKARRLVRRIQGIVGGKANAWLIVIAYGLKGTIPWVRKARGAVQRIQIHVGGPARAWLLVRTYGIDKTEQWVEDATPVVGTVQEILLSVDVSTVDPLPLEKMSRRGTAWDIVRSQGISNAVSWTQNAAPKAKEIAPKVGGMRMAWTLLIQFGSDEVVSWVERFEPRARRLAPEVGSLAAAWTILHNYSEPIQWFLTAKPVADELIADIGNKTLAWRILISQGAEATPEWSREMRPIAQVLQPEVGGAYNAWSILTRIEKTRLPTWMDAARLAVRSIEEEVGGTANAWRIVLTQGPKDAVNWTSRARPIAINLIANGMTLTQAWAQVIRHKLVNTVDEQAAEEIIPEGHDDMGTMGSGAYRKAHRESA